MGRAEKPSRYDAAAETRQFSEPGMARFTDPEAGQAPGTQRFEQVPGTQKFEQAPDTQGFGQVPGTQRPRHASDSRPSNQAPDTRPIDQVPIDQVPIDQVPGNPEPAPGPVTDPSRAWEQSDEPGHTHDPHEVTVQLDGVGRELEDWLVQQAKDAPAGQDSDGPVFVDETGRRRSRLRRMGIVVGLVCAVYAVVMGVTLMSGNSDAPWMPGLGQQDDEPAKQVDTSPLPADPADPSQTPSGSPSAGTSPTADVTPPPGSGASADPSGEAPAPGASTGPRPSTSPNEPAGDPSPEAPETGEPPSLPDPPDPSTPSDPSPAPTDSTDTSGGTGTDAGSGPVAGGAPGPGPVASGAAPSSLSPEYPENIA
ncbi:hypothetical protein E0500_003555 [Streptomyces sp. KM273126]|uniref:hypothetical protein n=1 Tax=Streptomyces sp. KM273126 TaxID=2545247 RepID=UPI00103FD7AF|nr:hypothetical protein [Streptomyces sp. KM273126]MBA2806555.1 hypothetical protein [Streptomyces sp. KM273126]